MAITGASLTPIYERLNGAPQYHPMDADTFADWSMEAGDVVTVTRGAESYDSPVHTSSMTWRGAPQTTISSVGNEHRTPVSVVSRRRYGRAGTGVRNDNYFYNRIDGVYNGLYSELQQTESRFWIHMVGLYDGLQSEFVVTRSELLAEFEGLYDGLSSEFQVTRSQLRAEFEGLYDGLQSEFVVTRSELRAEFEGLYDGLQSEFVVTRSELRAEFEGLYDGLQSEFVVTRSELRAEFEGLYDGLRSDFQVTRSEMRAEFEGLYDGLRSDFQVTRSEMRADFEGLYDGLRSEFQVTRSQLRTEFRGLYDGLRSDFQVTRSAMVVQFEGLYDGLRSDFQVTRSEMRTEFESAYDELKSYVTQSANEWRVMVEGTGNNKHIKPAVIQASIDSASQESKIRLSADHITLDGDVVASALSVLDVVTVQAVEAEDGTSTFHDFNVTHEYIEGAESFDSTDIVIGAKKVEDVDQINVYDAGGGTPLSFSVSGNTLTITDELGASITFNKAAPLISGSWSGTTYTAIQDDNGSQEAVTTVHLTIDGALNPNQTVYAKIFKDNPSDPLNQIDLREMKLEEVVNGASSRVKLSVKVVVGETESWLEKGSVSTAATYNSVTVASIRGTKLGDTSTRKSITLVAQASNSKIRGETVTLSDPTTYTDANNVSHRCVTLSGKYEENGAETSGVIGRVNIDSVYTAGQSAATVSGAWSNGTLTAYNTSNSSNSWYTTISSATNADVSWSGYTGTITLYAYNNGAENRVAIGKTLTVNATGAYNNGWDYGITRYVVSAAEAASTDVVIKSLSAGQKWKITYTFTKSDSTTTTSTYVVKAPDEYHITGTWDKTSSSLTNNNRITITRTTSGSTNSLAYVISATAGITYDSTTHKYTASAVAKVDGTQRGETSTTTSGLQAYNAGWDYGITRYVVSAAEAASTDVVIKSLSAGQKWKITYTFTKSDSTTTTSTYVVKAPDEYHITGTWDKTSSSLTNNNRITITRTTSGSTNSLAYVISATSGISFNSTTKKYTASAVAKVDGTQRGETSTASSGVLSFDLGNWNDSTHQQYISLKEGSTTIMGTWTNATGQYTKGWEDCYAEVNLNYTTDQPLGFGGSRTIYPTARPTPTGQHGSITTKGITITSPAMPTYVQVALYSDGSPKVNGNDYSIKQYLGNNTWSAEISAGTLQGLYFPLADNASITANGTYTPRTLYDNWTYYGFRSVTVNVQNVHPNKVTFTYDGMTSSQAGGVTVYTFHYSLTNTTGNRPYSGRTEFYY